jgi:hypothetical protein
LVLAFVIVAFDFLESLVAMRAMEAQAQVRSNR